MGNEEKLARLFDNLLFPKIFQTFRMAIQPSKLIIGFLALAAICLAGWIMDFNSTVVTTPGIDDQTELQIYLSSPDQVNSYIKNYKGQSEPRGVFSTLWHFAAARFHGALNSLFILDMAGVKENTVEYFKAIGWAFRYHFVYCIIFLTIKLAVISVSGGSLCRIAALQFTRGEKPGLIEALRFSTKKFLSFFGAPLALVGIIIFIGLFIFILGLIGSIPRFGELIMSIFMPLALIAGSLIAVIFIGTLAGFNLMFPAVAYDGSDCFDAISRSFSYVYARPWRMGVYTATAAVYGAICYTFVRFFAFLLLWVTHGSSKLGARFISRLFGLFGVETEVVRKFVSIWPEPGFMNLLGSSVPIAVNWSESIAAFLIYLFSLVVIGFVGSFIISFYFSANTIIYALMRNKVDNTALENIYTYSDDIKTETTAT